MYQDKKKLSLMDTAACQKLSDPRWQQVEPSWSSSWNMEKEVDNHLQRSRRRRGRILRKINQCRFSPDANLVFVAPVHIMFVSNFLVLQKLSSKVVLGYILIALFSGVQCTNWK